MKEKSRLYFYSLLVVTFLLLGTTSSADDIEGIGVKTDEMLNSRIREIRELVLDVQEDVNDIKSRLKADLMKVMDSKLEEVKESFESKLKQLNSNIDEQKEYLKGHINYAAEEASKTLTEAVEAFDGKLVKLQSEMYDNIDDRLNRKIDAVNVDIKLQNLAERLERKMSLTMEDTHLKNYAALHFPSVPYTAVSCGGIIVGKEGILRFRMDETYSEFRKCIWTVRAENYKEIKLQVLFDTFATEDFITVTDISRSYYDSNLDNSIDTISHGGLNLSTNSSKIVKGDRTIFNFTGPLLFITFVTKQFNDESGFLLKFEAVENSKYNTIDQNVVHINYHHSSRWKEDFKYPENGEYPDNVIWTMVINPPIASSDERLQINLKYIDIEEDSYCDADSLTFYNFKTCSNLTQAKRFCQPKQNLTNVNIVSTDAFVITFMSDEETSYRGFHFSWETQYISPFERAE